ncbi:MAG TPA: PH domain-containing protein [Nocardioidaceae bacterium]|nr:PH domain-containing protein [Nocardioidaceae bacterium]
MGLSEDELGSDERVVLAMHEHPKHLLMAALICLAALVGLVVVLAIAPESGFLAWLDTLGWAAFALVVVVFGVFPFSEWRARTYTITNERIATRRGVFRRSGRDIPLDRVNDVAFEQGIVDRMVKAGTLKISSASEEGLVVFRDIPRIHEVTKTLNQLVREARGAA